MSTPHPRSRARFGAAVIAVALAALASATPAFADDQASLGGATSPDVKVATGGPGKPIAIYVYGEHAVHPKLTIDASGLKGVATPSFDDQACTTGSDSTKATCDLPDEDSLMELLPIFVQPKQGAAVGASGTISFTTSADNVSPETWTTTVTLADGVDMWVMPGDPKPEPHQPGDAVQMPVAFFNAGNRTVNGVRVTFTVDSALIPEQYDDCQYSDASRTGAHLVVCDIPEIFQPGDGVFGMFNLTVAKDAYGRADVDQYVEGSDEPSTLSKVKLTRPSTGRHLVLKRTTRPNALDIDKNDNFALFSTQISNGHDLAALGATGSGAVGDTVKVKVGIKNNGPGTLDSTRGAVPAAYFVFIPPTGTTVVTVPTSAFCVSIVEENGSPTPKNGAPGGTYYRCGTSDLFKAGDSYQVEFGLKIDKANVTKGSVSLNDKYATDPTYHDDNTADNTADVVLTVTGGTGGSLPVTGAQTGMIAAAGLVVLALGGLLYILARRRRVILVADPDQSSVD